MTYRICCIYFEDNSGEMKPEWRPRANKRRIRGISCIKVSGLYRNLGQVLEVDRSVIRRHGCLLERFAKGGLFKESE